MIIDCIRCGKPIDSPHSSNADYIIADDTKMTEVQEQLVAIKHTEETWRKMERNEVIQDDEYQVVVVESPQKANEDPDTIRVELRMLPVSVQKTGIICPECYRGTDFIIWGVHKTDGK